jgi:hypothetical protein
LKPHKPRRLTLNGYTYKKGSILFQIYMWSDELGKRTWMRLEAQKFQFTDFIQKYFETNDVAQLCQKFNNWLPPLSEDEAAEKKAGKAKKGKLTTIAMAADANVEKAKAKRKGDVIDISLDQIESAPAEYQPRDVYKDNVAVIMNDMGKSITDWQYYLGMSSPFLVFFDKVKDKYQLFDGNHNIAAMRLMFEKTENVLFTKHRCIVYEGILPHETVLLGMRQNHSGKKHLEPNEKDLTFALRRAAEAHHPECDPPGVWPDMSHYHYGLLGIGELEYIAKKRSKSEAKEDTGLKSKYDTTYHQRFFATSCNKKTWAACEQILKRYPKKSLNQEYRYMKGLPLEHQAVVFEWVVAQDKIEPHVWKKAKAIAEWIADHQEHANTLLPEGIISEALKDENMKDTVCI